VLVHLAAISELSRPDDPLPPEMARALSEDLEYARLGVVLPDLPIFEGVRGGVGLASVRLEPPAMAQKLHGHAPQRLGLKLAELVANGALVGTEAGLALLCGYFTHLCLDEVLHPAWERLAQLSSGGGWQAQRRAAFSQSVAYLTRRFGRPMLGDPELRPLFQVTKRQGLPTRGIGRGMYELIRVATQETFRESLRKSELDGCLRGLYLFGRIASGPLWRTLSVPRPFGMGLGTPDPTAPDLTVEVTAALGRARTMVRRLHDLIAHNRFTPRSRERFLEEFPDRSLGACPL
jgi:hypothetical protein